jgi:hypothetical protein
MNETLQAFARQTLKDGLAQLGDGEHRLFKLMYGRNGGKRSVEDALAMPIDAVVDEVRPEQLDWAMRQVDGSLYQKAEISQ